MELEAIRLKYDQVRETINATASEHLGNFRVAKGADTKALYEKRLHSFLELLFERLYPDNQ